MKSAQQTVRFFETLLRSSVDGILITDGSQNIIVANEIFCSFLGRDMGDVLETNLSVWLNQLNHGASALWTELEKQTHSDGVFMSAEFQITTGEGVKYLKVNASLMAPGWGGISPDESSEKSGEESTSILTIWRDITESKMAKEALAESERRHREVVELSTEAIISSVDGAITLWNRAAEQMFGYTVEEAMGMEVTTIISEEPLDKGLAPWERVGDTKIIGWSGKVLELEGRKKDGTTFPMELSVSSTRKGEAQVRTVIIRDITERKEGEQALKRRARQLGALHKISQIALMDTPLSDSYRDIVDEIGAVTGFPTVSIEYYDWRRGKMIFRGLKGIETPPSDKPFEVDVAESLSGVVAKSGESMVETEALSRPEYRNETLRRLGIQTFICVPMKIGALTVGVISMGHHEKVPISDDFVLWAESLANHIAVLTDFKRVKRRLERIFNLTPDMICIVSPDGYFRSLNPAWEDVLGFSREELLSKRLSDLMHHDDRESALAKIEMEFKEASTISFESRCRCKDGSYKVLAWRAHAVEGGVLYGVARDVTEIRAASDALKAGEERLQSILDNSTAVIYVKDIYGKYLLVNSLYEKLFGVGSREVIGMTDYAIFPRDAADAMRANDLIVADTCKAVELEEVVPHDDGDHTYLSVKFPLYDSSGEIYAVCAIATDITDRKRAEDAIRHKQTQLEALLHVSRKINSSLEVEVVMGELVDAAITLMNATSGTAGLIEGGRMRFTEYRRGDEIFAIDYAFDEGFGVPGHVMQTRAPYITNDAEGDPHVIAEIRQTLNFHQLIDVPILDASGDVIGCFEIHDGRDSRPFDEGDVELLQGLAASAAIALENARLSQERRADERALRLMVEGTSAAVGEAFFKNLVRSLADAISAKIVFCARFVDDSAHALALWLGDDFVENLEWRLAGTPCERVAKGESVLIKEGVQARFPDDRWLTEVEAESYVGIPLVDTQGHIVGHIGVIDDKAIEKSERIERIMRIFVARACAELERQQAEEALSIEKEKLELVISGIGAGLNLVDGETRVVWANEVFQEWFGSLEELSGKSCCDLYRLKDPDNECAAIRARESGRVESTGPITYVNSDGTIRYFQITVTPVRDVVGEITQYVEVVQDVTERAFMEEMRRDLIRRLQERNFELEAKSDELERFTYTVSHDLKSPLITIRGFIALLYKEMESDDRDRMKHDMERIDMAAKHMDALLKDLLELSCVGKIVNPSEELSLGEVVSATVRLLSRQIENGGVTVEIAQNLPTVFADRQRLREVYQNLIENAIKFKSDRPLRIEIGVREEGDQTVLFVRDNGIGIDPKYQERVFGLFERLSRKGDGTGIGLAIVKRIIEFHGGRVWFESEGEGYGATFCFTLPERKAENTPLPR